jgi:hypothetical protein
MAAMWSVLDDVLFAWSMAVMRGDPMGKQAVPGGSGTIEVSGNEP